MGVSQDIWGCLGEVGGCTGGWEGCLEVFFLHSPSIVKSHRFNSWHFPVDLEGPGVSKNKNVLKLRSFWPIGKPRERFQSWVIRVYFVSVPNNHIVTDKWIFIPKSLLHWNCCLKSKHCIDINFKSLKKEEMEPGKLTPLGPWQRRRTHVTNKDNPLEAFSWKETNMLAKLPKSMKIV